MGAELVLGLWAGLGGLAQAWSTNGSRWDWQGRAIEDPIHVAPGTFPADEVAEEDLLAAIDGAMLTWNDAGYDLSLSRGEDVESATQEADGALVLFHGVEADMGTTLAYTSVWGYEDGQAYDCDLLFLDADDAGDIVWSADPDGPTDGTWDLQSVALHELGHCLGLSHSEDGGAIMNAHYTGARTLGADDLEGLAALYDLDCADADADGVSACDGDCADDNALVSPATVELCDGVDDNCNGIVDEGEGTMAALGDDSNDADWSEQSIGNGFQVNAATTLRSLRQRWEGPAGARLVWSVSRRDGRSWTRISEAIGVAASDAWQQSPDLNLVLEEGETYAVVLGSIADGVTMYYQKRPALDAVGPVTPLGSIFGRAIGDELSTSDDRYLVDQSLRFTGEGGTACPEDTGDTADSGAPDETGDTAGGETGPDSVSDTGSFKPGADCACAEGGGSAGRSWVLLALAGALLRRRARAEGVMRG